MLSKQRGFKLVLEKENKEVQQAGVSLNASKTSIINVSNTYSRIEDTTAPWT
jgi:hypothetical protein